MKGKNLHISKEAKGGKENDGLKQRYDMWGMNWGLGTERGQDNQDRWRQDPQENQPSK